MTLSRRAQQLRTLNRIKLISFLGVRGFDPLYGARPLKRVIQNEVLNKLAKSLIAGDLKEGAQIHLSANDLGVEVK